MNKNAKSIIYSGLDISKLKLQADLAGRIHNLPNTGVGHLRLLKLMAGIPHIHVVCEPTCGYERDILAALQTAKIPVSLVNPVQVQRFARSTGRRVKARGLDAGVLTNYGQAWQPKPLAARTEKDQHLDELIRLQMHLLEMLVAQRREIQRLTVPALRRQALSLRRRLERGLNVVQEQIQILRPQPTRLDERVQKLLANTGVEAAIPLPLDDGQNFHLFKKVNPTCLPRCFVP
jgi:transposase